MSFSVPDLCSLISDCKFRHHTQYLMSLCSRPASCLLTAAGLCLGLYRRFHYGLLDFYQTRLKTWLI